MVCIYGIYADPPPVFIDQRTKEIKVLTRRIAFGLASPLRTKRRLERLEFLLQQVQQEKEHLLR